MREIKFRAWHKKINEYLTSRNDIVGFWECVRLYGLSVEQYTGLKDKNGKEIYEGDIVTCYWEDGGAYNKRKENPLITKVEFDDTTTGFMPFSEYDSDCGQYIVMDGVKILGNINENPELLK